MTTLNICPAGVPAFGPQYPNRGCPTFRGFRKVGGKTDRSIPVLAFDRQSKIVNRKSKMVYLAPSPAAFDPLAVDVPAPSVPASPPFFPRAQVRLQIWLFVSSVAKSAKNQVPSMFSLPLCEGI